MELRRKIILPFNVAYKACRKYFEESLMIPILALLLASLYNIYIGLPYVRVSEFTISVNEGI